MSIVQSAIMRVASLFGRVAEAEQVASKLPLSLSAEALRVSDSISRLGLQLHNRNGTGMEFNDRRLYRPDGGDDPRKIDHRASSKLGADRHGKPQYLMSLKRAEVPQHFYFWRDATESMTFSSDPDKLLTPKSAAEIMMLALTKLLVRNQDVVHLLGMPKSYTGSAAMAQISAQFEQNLIPPSPLPRLSDKPIRHSTAILWSDFIPDEDDANAYLERLKTCLRGLQAAEISGYVVQLFDPLYLNFNMTGRVELEGLEGEGKLLLPNAAAQRDAVLGRIRAHQQKVKDIARSCGLTYIEQRTDMPLHKGLLPVFGVPQETSAQPAPRL